MNERIQELAEQAGLYVDLPSGTPWPRAMSAEECQAAYEKFAELIVKETIQVVANQLPSNQYLDVAHAVIGHYKDADVT
jgi:hypothetical protein